MSWQHLVFVSSLVAVMIFLGVFLGRRHRTDSAKRDLTLKITAILIDSLELFKIILLCFRSNDALDWLYNLPLFLCSIQLIAIPIAAFSRGRLKESALDFVLVFGMLGAILGTYFAGNNYAVYPVLSFDNVVSGLTHTISGFAALYIGFSGLSCMKKRNLGITVTILLGFCLAAFVANSVLDYNYMFLVRGDGTPYDIIYNLLGGNAVLYPLTVVGLFVVYILLFYWIFNLARGKKGQNA